MEAVGVYTQQALFQQKMGIAMLKQSAEAQKSIVNMIAETVNATGRGQMLNVLA